MSNHASRSRHQQRNAHDFDVAVRRAQLKIARDDGCTCPDPRFRTVKRRGRDLHMQMLHDDGCPILTNGPSRIVTAFIPEDWMPDRT